MNTLFDPQVWLSLFTLTALEVVLSVDNLVVIALLVGKLPSPAAAARPQAWNDLGLGAASGLLFAIGWVLSLTEPLFSAFGQSFTGKDLILIAGGIFLVYKAVQEIHANLEGVEGEATAKVYGKVATVVIQIAVINLVFSIDSIVTAVGLATEIWVMAVAVILSMIVLMAAARPVGEFVERHPTTKMLALSFLVMIGTTLSPTDLASTSITPSSTSRWSSPLRSRRSTRSRGAGLQRWSIFISLRQPGGSGREQ